MATNILHQTIEAQRTWLNAAYSTSTRLQDQSEQILRTYMNTMPWMDENTRKTVDTWLSSYKEGRDTVKKAIDENFDNMEKIFTL